MKYVVFLLSVLFFSPINATEPSEKSKMLGLRTTVYMVNDIEKAKNWYAQAFGISPYFDEPYYVGFNVAGFELGLMPTSEDATHSNVIA